MTSLTNIDQNLDPLGTHIAYISTIQTMHVWKFFSQPLQLGCKQMILQTKAHDEYFGYHNWFKTP